MLRALITSAISRLHRKPVSDELSGTAFPADDLRVVNRRHERAPLDLHTEILFKGASVAGADLLQLYDSCMQQTGTLVSPWKAFIRIQGASNLARYFLHTLSLEGARAECGVFQGFSALFACRAAALSAPGYDGTGFHLVDSFAGFPQPKTEDFIPLKARGEAHFGPAFSEGSAAAPFEKVRSVFREFPGVSFHRGYVPDILTELPAGKWAFVHIDLDLYEPTLTSLQYFYPRMVKSGVIICDDYGSTLFPGARKAWDSYCESNDIAFVTLETGQSVIIKQ